MRDLEQSDKNTLTIKDAISGTDIELYYRLPMTPERVAYQSRMFRTKGGKMKVQVFEARIEFGLKILTGFREGDFGIKGKPIASDPQSKNYQEDWKELIKATAADIVNAFAFVVFEGATLQTETETGQEEELALDSDRGEDHPLESPSVQS